MVIRRGDIYWLDLGKPEGAEHGFRRPVIVTQSNLFNDTTVQTVIVCVLSSNLSYAHFPGNVIVQPEESGLPRDSVVNVTQLVTIDRSRLNDRDYCGTVSASVMSVIHEGIRLIFSLVP